MLYRWRCRIVTILVSCRIVHPTKVTQSTGAHVLTRARPGPHDAPMPRANARSVPRASTLTSAAQARPRLPLQEAPSAGRAPPQHTTHARTHARRSAHLRSSGCRSAMMKPCARSPSSSAIKFSSHQWRPCVPPSSSGAS
eukprot:6730479-Prymnesium_polylepis.1